MQFTLDIGNTSIPYVVRWSDRARRKRIVATPAGVEVVAPTGTPVDGESGVKAFVAAKRRWVFDANREVAEKHRERLEQRWASGCKLQYRGRRLMLRVTASPEVEAVEIRCRSRFDVTVPEHLDDTARLEAVEAAFGTWLRERAQRDLERFGRRHAARLEVEPAGYRLSDSKHRWGSLGKDGIVRVHWRLVQAPAAAMEHVVAHELAHLEHRHHDAAFWNFLARTLPDWPERKALLERWEIEHRRL